MKLLRRPQKNKEAVTLPCEMSEVVGVSENTRPKILDTNLHVNVMIKL